MPYHLTNTELADKWLAAFGAGVEKTVLEEHVTSYGNYFWHLFTWGSVPCLEGDAARNALDTLQYGRAIKFYDGYSGKIKNVSAVGKTPARELDDDPEWDVYLVAEDFSWTYVRTHEAMCGPYFCRRA